MGRTPEKVNKEFTDGRSKTKKVKVKLFTWEELDGVKDMKKVFNTKIIN